MATDNAKLIFAQMVNAKAAKLLYATYSELAQAREIAIWWKGEDQYLNAQIIKALDTYGSSLNYPTPCMYVVNPFGDDHEEYTGTWRIVQNRMGSKSEGGGIVQVLREGWATALTESEARIGRYFVDTQNGTYGFTRYWPNIAITSLKALVTGLKDTKTVTDPQARGVTHTGTFALGQPTGEPQEDGAGVVTQTLRMVSSPTSATTLAALTPVVQIGSQIIDPYAMVTAPTLVETEEATASLTFRDLNPASATESKLTLKSEISDATLESALVGTAKWLPTGWKVQSRGWQEDPASNTASFVVGFIWRNNTNIVPHVERVANDQVARTWYRVDATTKDALIRAAVTGPPAVALGIARSSFTYDYNGDGTGSSDTFTHAALYVTDHHDRTFSVQQVGTRQGAGATTNIYYSKSFTTKDPVESRIYNGIAQTKQRTYTHYIKYFTGEEWAAAAIETAAGSAEVVEGSVNIKTIRPNYVKAEWTEVALAGTWA
jgi:hypothetical protein